MKSFYYNNERLGSTRRNKTWIGAIALGLTVSLLGACSVFDPTDQANDQAVPDNVTSDDVVEAEPSSPAIGEIVTIRSGIVETLDDSGFVMETGDGSRILVINLTGTPFTPPEQDIPIQVTGQLDTFNAAESVQQYGTALDPTLYNEYDQQPVIIVDNFALAPRPQDLSDASDDYLDQAIAVEGDFSLLEDTDNAFALFEEGWVDDIGVLVIGVSQSVDISTLEDGENIVVTGQARPADAALLQDADLGWDEAEIQDFLERYENRPVIVADEVYPSADSPHPNV